MAKHHTVALKVPQLVLTICLAPNRLTQYRRDDIYTTGKEHSLEAGSTRSLVHLVYMYNYYSMIEKEGCNSERVSMDSCNVINSSSSLTSRLEYDHVVTSIVSHT